MRSCRIVSREPKGSTGFLAGDLPLPGADRRLKYPIDHQELPRAMKGVKRQVSPIRAIDLFCGAGGSSWGVRTAGVEIVAGFDRWDKAGEAYHRNFPEARFVLGRLEDNDPHELLDQLGGIDILLASPECTNHSPAKGNQPRCELSRETAFQVTRYAEAFEPRWIIVENVVGMRNWQRYDKFIATLKELGYHVSPQVLKADRFGVPTSRRRLFLLCDKERMPSNVKPSSGVKVKTAREIVDLNGNYRWSPLRTPRRAKATLERAERGIAAVGKNKPFLMVYYGTDHAGGWQSLDVPLRTITTVDRFAAVRPSESGHEMRMLQVPELKAAMSFPKRFIFPNGTRREQIHMIGNAVCPRLMRRVVRILTGSGRRST